MTSEAPPAAPPEVTSEARDAYLTRWLDGADFPCPRPYSEEPGTTEQLFQQLVARLEAITGHAGAFQCQIYYAPGQVPDLPWVAVCYQLGPLPRHWDTGATTAALAAAEMARVALQATLRESDRRSPAGLATTRAARGCGAECARCADFDAGEAGHRCLARVTPEEVPP